MRIIILYNKDLDHVISRFGRQNTEVYNEEAIRKIESIFLDQDYEVRIIDGNLDLFDKLRGVIAEKDKIPFVFNMAYGIQGEGRYTHIPSILEMLGLPYLGSGPIGHTIALDKVLAKNMMRVNNIPTPYYREFATTEDMDKEVEFPVILKPAMEAGSFGLQIIQNREELEEALPPLLEEFPQPVFAERLLKGKEYAIGLLGNGENLRCLPIIEMEYEDEIYTDEAKKVKPKISAAKLPEKKVMEMEEQAKSLFRLMRLRDYARADIRMDEQGNHYFLEVNSMAGLQTTGVFIQAAELAGYAYGEIIRTLLDVGVRKYFKTNQKLKVRYESKSDKSGK